MPRGVRRRVVTCLTRCFAHPSSSFASTLDLFLIPFSREISLSVLSRSFASQNLSLRTKARQHQRSERKTSLPSQKLVSSSFVRSFVRSSLAGGARPRPMAF